MEDRLKSSEDVICRYHLRNAIEICCATCRHFDHTTDDCGCGECTHPSTQSHGDYNGPLVYPKSHQVCDLWEKAGSGATRVLRAVVRIPRELLDKYAAWMSADGHPELNDEQRRLGVAQVWSVRFEDGVQADVKVCCVEENCWCEVVWFTEGGQEYTCSSPDDDLGGAWYDHEVMSGWSVVHELLVLAEDEDEEDW